MSKRWPVRWTSVDLPSWVQAEEDRPAPGPLLLVQAFVNTWDADRATDQLDDPAAARAWLHDSGLIGDNVAVTPEDLLFTRGVRTGLRALLDQNAGGPVPGHEQLVPLDALTRACLPRLSLGPDARITLVADGEGGLQAGLLTLLLVMRDAQVDGTWWRLKTCGNPSCRWAFYDRSHSRRGTWCDMSSCGNLMKNRNLRARRRRVS